MKPTKKSINAALPRLDFLRRNYMLHDYGVGIAYGYGYLRSAWADLDEDGNVSYIRIYSVGDAMERRHYYNEPGSVDITDAIENAIREESDRWHTIDEIQSIIIEDGNDND